VLLASERDSARRELDALLYAISHDLRAPLRSLSGFGQALAELQGANLDATAAHYLGRMQAASRKLSEMIDALLSLSRIAQADFAKRRVDITQLCGEAAATVLARYAGRAIDLQIAAGMQAFGDSRMLRTLLELLLDNACKFTARNAQATIAVAPVSAAGNAADGMYAFSVTDNGVGFDATYADKLFQPFRRLHAESDFAGIGIGLAAAKNIVARHAGSIRLESLQPGARVVVTLPTA
jgi:signal transduction histidine kinase